MLSVHTSPLATLGGKETGGMNVYVRDLTRELARRGHRVDIYTRAQDPNLPHVDPYSLAPGARIIRIPAGPMVPYNKYRVYDHLAEFTAGVQRQARQNGIHYDVIHSHYWLSGVVAQELRRHWAVPIVQMFHTLGRMKNAVAHSADHREPAIRIQTETEIVRRADALVAATEVEREQLIRLYAADPGHIHIIPPGVDTDRFRPIPVEQAKERIGVCTERRVILFVGRIEPLKGIDHLLYAIARVVERRPELREGLCVPIVGGDLDPIHLDDEMVRLQELREEIGIGDIVTFLGAKDQEQLPYCYAAAEMVVMPSDYESFGMVALEAMACGTPVIASDVGGLSVLVRHGETGYRVPARDTEALADCIIHLLAEEDLRQRIGAQAVRWARSFAWPRVADQIETLYRALLPVTAR